MKPVSFHPALDAEVQAAARYYEDKQPGLGDELLELIERTTDYVRRYLTRCQILVDNVRERKLTRFPYALIFQTRPEDIHIVALMHNSRCPGYWKSRLSADR